MDLSNVTFIKVDIEEAKIVSFFRRSGPLYNVTLPKSEYVFLNSNGYKMTVRQYIMSDGSVVNVQNGEQPAPVAVAAAQPAPEEKAEEAVTAEEETTTEETTTDETSDEVTEEQSEEAPAEEQPEEPAPTEEEVEEPAPVVLPEDLCSTIEATEDSIQVHTLTMEQYATYTKAELLKFVKALSASLPDEVVKQVENDRNISKRVLLEIIDANVVTDE